VLKSRRPTPISPRFFLSFFLFMQGNNTTSFSTTQPSYSPQCTISITNSQLYFFQQGIIKNEISLPSFLFSTVSYLLNYTKSFDQLYKRCFRQWFDGNRHNIICYGVGGWYASTGLLLLLFDYYFNQPDLWSDWQSMLSLRQLYVTSEELLQQKLIGDIQQRYINQQNPIDFTSPFATFLQKITREERYINYYLMLLNGINNACVAKLFFVSEKTVNKIKLRKQRLTLIKELFLSWLVAYNIKQVQHKQAT